eukprot:6176913-Pleurochrysis_carterae.AAC.5
MYSPANEMHIFKNFVTVENLHPEAIFTIYRALGDVSRKKVENLSKSSQACCPIGGSGLAKAESTHASKPNFSGCA